ncbi:hypothetical protein AAGC94_07850 [Clostridium sporogenes]|uniref:hypothetical protein n=1 Tax=Clostridium TaxID=1485 RepID=UPI001969D21A|nr:MULTISPECIES: hypothetical protein [Clostridium]MBN3348296.1 hypothetical protein [Clostridium botulinum]MCW6091344.1 hypothetical protein [Clostridium sporogenes]
MFDKELKKMFDMANRELDINYKYTSNETLISLIRIIKNKLKNYKIKKINGIESKYIKINGKNIYFKELETILKFKIKGREHEIKSIDNTFLLFVVSTVLVTIPNSIIFYNKDISTDEKIVLGFIIIFIVYIIGYSLEKVRVSRFNLPNIELKFYYLVLNILEEIGI